jgi:uncharacterized repeat protein (TIGR03803 family)
VIRDSAGNLYGTTYYGGAYGAGTVYKLAPDGTLTLLYSFNSSDGANPSAGVMQDSAGNLYGTTSGGGAYGAGTVYKLAPSIGALTVLHTFDGSDGANPTAGVIRDSAGNLYGTTSSGGTSGGGTVFQLTISPYTFLGFFQPVDNPPTVNAVKNGATVPVKWKLQDRNGTLVTDVGAVAPGWPKAQKISCATLTADPEDAIETTGTGKTSLRYDSTSRQFVYNWQTPKQGNTCWRLDINFIEGTTKSAYFKLK